LSVSSILTFIRALYVFLLSLRILYFVTCVCAFVVFSFYTAVLTSWMTSKSPPVPVKVSDLNMATLEINEKLKTDQFQGFLDAMQKKYNIYYWKGTATEDYLRDRIEFKGNITSI
jgi:hypothetical protein